MAQLAVRWDQLSDSARGAFEWAVAVESPNDVGSRGLLIGLIRSEKDSEPGELLRHFGVEQPELDEALQTVRPEVRIDPDTNAPVSGLDDFPSLTTNAQAVLGRAAELWKGAGEGAPLQGRDLFGGILSNPQSRAYQALDRVLKGRAFDLSSLASTYDEYVLDPKRPSYANFLRERFPTQGAPTPATTPMPDDAPSTLRIYLNYRREDEPHIPLRRLLDELRGRFGRDSVIVDDVNPDGADPRGQIRRFLDESAALVVAVGSEWLTAEDTRGRRRLTMPDDQLRFEIETAIAEEVPVVPVIFSGATMPAASDLPESVAALASVAPVNFPAEDFETAFAELVDRLESASRSRTPRSEPRISIGTLDGATNDAVADEDQLGFAHYVDAFVDLITSPYTKPPLTIGIFGSWGMGKSFLLTHIEREICERQGDKAEEQLVGPQVHVVTFDAWESNATEKVWPSLVRKVLTKLDQDVPWPRHKQWWTRLKYNVPREVRRLRAPLLAALLVVTALVITAVVTSNKAFLAAVTSVVGALGVAGLIKAANDPIAHWVTTLFAESDYGRQIGYMEEIRRDLETLEARLHEDGDASKGVTHRILVLVDDLDRCEPEKAVEVLQAVNLLLNFESFIVCLGIDARIVTGAVEKHYEGLLGRAGASGYEYLDKIVQIPFRIPEPGEADIKTFLSRQLGDPRPPPESTLPPVPESTAETAPAAPGGNGAEQDQPPVEAPPASEEATPSPTASDPEAAIPFTVEELEAFTALAKFLRPNPRHLKRLVNVYRLVRALARAQGESLILERPGATIRWLVLWAQWPYTANAMLEQFERMLDQWGNDIQAHVPRTDPLLHLHEAATKGLDRKARDSIDDPENELKGLLRATDFSLAWDDLPRIRKYTVNFNPAVEERLQAAGSASDAERSGAENAETESAPAA